MYFSVDTAEPAEQEIHLRAPMPYVPRVGETLLFPMFSVDWARYRVVSVEYMVHHFRSDGYSPFAGSEHEMLGKPDNTELDYDDLWSLDKPAASTEVYVKLVRHDRDAE